MKPKKVALIDANLLKLSNAIMHRSVKEQKLRFKRGVRRGVRVEAIAAIYNMLVLGLISDYESFLELQVTIQRQPTK